MKRFKGHFLDGDIEAYHLLGKRVPLAGTAVEIGVMFGKSLQVLCELFKNDIAETQRKIFAVDTWKGTSDESNTMALYARENVYEIFLNNIKEFGYNHMVTPVRKDSLIAAKDFKNQGMKFDLIFLDSMHDLNFVQDEIKAWLPNLKLRGIISGHDYKIPGSVGMAVNLIFGKRSVQTYQGGSVWSVNWENIPRKLFNG